MKQKKYFFVAAMLLFASFASADCKHENYIGNNDVADWMWKYYPSWTPGSAPAGTENDNFFIGRVRPLKRFTNVNSQVIQDSKKDMRRQRKVLWWVPINEGGWTSLPRYTFDSEVFSSWSYIDIHGNWTQGLLRQPGAFADVCHKNGVATSVVSAAPWAEHQSNNDGGHGQNYYTLTQGGADKLMQLLKYYGIDGIGFNSEQTWESFNAMKTLFFNCHNLRDKYDMDLLHFDFYNLSSSLSASSCGSTSFDCFFPAANGFFLNYNWGSLASPVAAANTLIANAGGNFSEYVSSYDVYAGMDMQGRSSAEWSYIDQAAASVGLWGAHNKNMIYQGSNELGSNPKSIQSFYQIKSEYFFTGGTRNPVNDLTISSRLCPGDPNFFGVSKLVAAKSTLSWVANDYFPFVTYFNLGNGEFFNNEGETTYNDEWYNIGVQDFLPTWRWWITTEFMGRETSKVPSGFSAEFTYEDAWFGGSCLKIENTNAANTSVYLQLFKTQFPIATGYEFTIRYKVLSGSATLQWVGSKEGSESTAVTRPIGAVSAANASEWTEKSVLTSAWTAFNGSTLAMLGLRFVNASADFKMLIGEISLKKASDTFSPVKPTLTKSQILKTTYKGVDFKVIWDCPVQAGGGTDPDPDPDPEPDVEPETAVRAATLNCTLSGQTEHSSRFLSALSFSGNQGASLSISGLQSMPSFSYDIWDYVYSDLYFDKRNESLVVKRGETITTTATKNGEWMMGYAYVDWNNDGDFEDANEYVAGHKTYPGPTNCWAPPAFTIPDNVELGTYTMRYTCDWNLTNDVDYGATHSCGRTATTVTDGGQNYTAANGGCMVDIELHVTANGGGSGSGGAVADDSYIPTYNDEVDAWYFEIWAQQSGKEPQLVTVTTSWAAYAVNVPFDVTGSPENQKVRIGVRTVAPDGETKSDIAWTDYLDASTYTQTDNVEISKPVIKPGESFYIEFVDPKHAVANWTIKNSATQVTVKTENGVTRLTFEEGLSDIGSYDVTINGVTTPGLIQISPEETGAVPEIYTLQTNKTSIADANAEVATLTFTSRDADGTVSKGLRVQDPCAFAARINDPNNYASTEFAKKAPYTYCLWFKVNDFIHSTQGINLLYKTDYTCDWPQNNWGEFWCQIRPEGAGKIPSGSCVANELSFNVCGWSAHDNARSGMTNGESLQKDVWYHLAVALDDNGYETMWINGRQVAYSYDSYVHDDGCQSAFNTNSNAFQRQFTRLYVGASGSYKAGFNGVVDEIQCWDKVLTTDEVRTAMRGFQKGSAPENLKGYWTFDETIEKTIRDTVRTVFPNWGTGTAEAVGYYTTTPTVNSDGTTSLNDLYETFYPAQITAGCPIIPGDYVVETVPEWRSTGGVGTIVLGTYTTTSGSATASNAEVCDPFRVYLKLVNSWASTEEQYVDIVVVDPTVGLDAVAESGEMKVYPNPFVERVSMMFPQEGEYTFLVVNLEGKCIYSQSKQVESGELVNMQINGEKGLYILQVKQGDKVLKSVKLEKK